MTNFNINNVSSFSGFDVRNGQIDISDDQYADLIDECNEAVVVCGMSFNASRVLRELDPIAWRCGLGDYESEIQSELEDAIENEDDSDIEWEDGKESNQDE